MPPADFDGPAEAPTTNNVLVMPIKFTDSPASDAFSGDTINTEMTVKQTRESAKGDRGVVTFDVVVKNQRGEVVCTYEENVLMRRRG